MIYLASLFFLSMITSAWPQEETTDIEALKKTAPRVFIDCGICDIEYIKTEITFVNYVRDRREAQVHILITTLRTGGGGIEYTVAFLGQNEFEGINDTLKYFSGKTDTEDEIRKGLVKTLKMGLMSYVARTPIARRISLAFIDMAREEARTDKWNLWVFSFSGNGFFMGETSYKSHSIGANFSANRVTPEWKIRLGITANYNLDVFSYEAQSIKSTSDSWSFSGMVVKSLGEHWSLGAFIDAGSSTYENIKFSLSPAPALEYNLFPYSQSTRRQLRFLYRAGLSSVRYREETIYYKTSERLWRGSLSVTLDVREKWGSVSTTISGSHYFHDFKKNRLTLFSILSFRIYKGLNIFTFGSYSMIHDQLSLAKGEATLEEILLRRRQLETNYNYFFSIGLSYTFGSIFTNVVNPRFGTTSGEGGLSIIVR